MTKQSVFRRLFLGLLTGCALTVAAISLPIAAGALTPAAAQVSGEFQDALAPYGSWRRHPQFGDVWVPSRLPRGWQPYQNGHWVYTDDWGWYWVSDDTEADWGWVAYHYGRWAFDRGFGWFWVPGDEWAPAWVDWRYGDDYVGWAPLPPDDLIDAYDDEPNYWVFVAPRYLTAPRPRSYFVPGNRRAAAFRSTRIVNRTVAVQGRRLAVNPGIPAPFIASVTRKPVPSFNVRPHVLAGTQGVTGAVVTRGGERGRGNAVSVQRTSTTIAPSASVAAPAALGKGERGRLGTHPPRAAQGAAAPAAAPAVAPASPPSKTPAVAPPPITTPAAPRAPTAASPATPPRPEFRRNPNGPPGGAEPPRPTAPAPQVAHPPPPVVHPGPPPAARPAPPVARPVPPPVAHPPPPQAAHPVPPKPPAAKPAPPAKPGEKPPEPPK